MLSDHTWGAWRRSVTSDLWPHTAMTRKTTPMQRSYLLLREMNCYKPAPALKQRAVQFFHEVTLKKLHLFYLAWYFFQGNTIIRIQHGNDKEGS